jgi:hypothetical protein
LGGGGGDLFRLKKIKNILERKMKKAKEKK